MDSSPLIPSLRVVAWEGPDGLCLAECAEEFLTHWPAGDEGTLRQELREAVLAGQLVYREVGGRVVWYEKETFMNETIETRDPATGRMATPAASAHAEAVYNTVWDAVRAAFPHLAEDSVTELAQEAYKTALFRHDNPWRRAA